MPFAFSRVGEGEFVVGVSGRSPPFVVDKMVMVGTQPDEVVSSGFSAVLPIFDVMDLADCVSAPGESALSVVADGDRLAHR